MLQRCIQARGVVLLGCISCLLAFSAWWPLAFHQDLGKAASAATVSKIDFVAKVKSKDGNRLVVSLPNGEDLTFTIDTQTDLKDLGGSHPNVNQMIEVEVTAHPDGSF